MTNQPKTESWEERLELTLDTYESLIDSDQEEYKMARKYLKDFIRHEKQLSYQEAVEKTENEIYSAIEKDKGIKTKLPHPVEAIKFRMEQYGHNQTTASKAIGITRSRLNEILHRARPLSVVQIRRLVKYGVPVEVLIQKYPLRHQLSILKGEKK